MLIKNYKILVNKYQQLSKKYNNLNKIIIKKLINIKIIKIYFLKLNLSNNKNRK
jgi:hypothetical protein